MLDVGPGAIVKHAFTELSLLVTIDESLSLEQACTIAAELGCTVRKKDERGQR